MSQSENKQKKNKKKMMTTDLYNAYILTSCTVLKITTIIAAVLSLCAISFLVYGNPANFTVYAQSYLQTVKQRN